MSYATYLAAHKAYSKVGQEMPLAIAAKEEATRRLAQIRKEYPNAQARYEVERSKHTPIQLAEFKRRRKREEEIARLESDPEWAQAKELIASDVEWALRWYRCERKVLHIWEWEALEAAQKGVWAGLQPYQCVNCTGFHLGHAALDPENPNLENITEKLAVALARL